ncbi:MAG: putative Ig domain-containing protein [Pseudomonadota bacterium]
MALSADGSILAYVSQVNLNQAGEGVVNVYRLTEGEWVQLGSTLAAKANEELGDTVALSSSGLTLAVGSRSNDSNGVFSCEARVYDLVADVWVQRGGDIRGTSFSSVGASVALAGDGQTLVVGSPGSPSAAIPSQIYRFVAGAWVAINPGISLVSSSDREGDAVALAEDGQTVALGAASNMSPSRVRVFRLSNTAPNLVGAPPGPLVPGESYGPFQPTEINDDPGETQTFALENAPGWVQFDPQTGELSGSPSSAEVGTTAGIVLSATEAAGGEGELVGFSITVLADTDADGIADEADNCPLNANASQADLNADGQGDVCDDDDDGDGTPDETDDFPGDASETTDSDGDGLRDNRETELGTNPLLADSDNDGFDDGEEIDAASDPLSAADVPTATGLSSPLIKAAMDRI